MIKKLLILVPAVALIVIGVYFIVTTSPFVRYWVDDFCSATLLRNNGYLGAQIAWWRSWTGRYSYIAFLDLFELIGPFSARVIPIILLGLMVLSFYRFYRVSKLLPLIFILLTLFNAPNIIQSFYWLTGSMNYITPFIFLNLFLSLLIYPSKKMHPIVPALLLFVAGGFSEAYALPQVIFLFFIFLFFKLTGLAKDKKRIGIFYAGLAGATLSIIVMYLAPGNIARETTVTQPTSLMFVIKSTILGTKWYLLRMLSVGPFIYSLLVIFSSVFFLAKPFNLNRKKSLKLMAIAILTAIFTTAAVIGSGFYSISIIPPERTLFIAIYFQLLSFLVFSIGCSSVLEDLISIKKQKLLSWGMVFLNMAAVFLLVSSVVSHWNSVRVEVQAYAADFDKIEPYLIQNKGKDKVSIKNIKPVGGLDSFTDNKGWVTGCLAGYYHIKQIEIAK